MPEPIDSPKIREVIRDLLSRGHAYSTYEVVGYLEITIGRRISESAVSARIRDLRKPEFGGYTVISRPRQGCTAWEYCIEVRNERAA
jgi:phage gp37-like protein